MGLPMAYEEDFHPQTPRHARNLASWLILQSARAQSNVSWTDTTHFAQCGAFHSRPVTQSTPATLRLEIHDASTSHLPQTLPDLLAVLHRQVQWPSHRLSLPFYL